MFCVSQVAYRGRCWVWRPLERVAAECEGERGGLWLRRLWRGRKRDATAHGTLYIHPLFRSPPLSLFLSLDSHSSLAPVFWCLLLYICLFYNVASCFFSRDDRPAAHAPESIVLRLRCCLAMCVCFALYDKTDDLLAMWAYE